MESRAQNKGLDTHGKGKSKSKKVKVLRFFYP